MFKSHGKHCFCLFCGTCRGLGLVKSCRGCGHASHKRHGKKHHKK